MAMSLLAERPNLAFFDARSLEETHCLDYSLVSGVGWLIHLYDKETAQKLVLIASYIAKH